MVLCLVSATQKYPLYWFHVLPAGVLAGNGNGEQGSIKAEILTGTALCTLFFSNKNILREKEAMKSSHATKSVLSACEALFISAIQHHFPL